MSRTVSAKVFRKRLEWTRDLLKEENRGETPLFFSYTTDVPTRDHLGCRGRGWVRGVYDKGSLASPFENSSRRDGTGHGTHGTRVTKELPLHDTTTQGSHPLRYTENTKYLP